MQDLTVPHSAYLLLVVWLLVGPAPRAEAAGPMTHMREAAEGARRLAEQEVAGLADLGQMVLDDEEVHVHMLLGTVMPDLREAIDGLGFDTHDRGLAFHLLTAVAADPARDPLDRAVALGYAAHVCSDIAAQVFYVCTFTAAGPLGASDVLVDFFDDRPDGENELWVEGAVDFYHGDPGPLLRLYDHWMQELGPTILVQTACGTGGLEAFPVSR